MEEQLWDKVRRDTTKSRGKWLQEALGVNATEAQNRVTLLKGGAGVGSLWEALDKGDIRLYLASRIASLARKTAKSNGTKISEEIVNIRQDKEQMDKCRYYNKRARPTKHQAANVAAPPEVEKCAIPKMPKMLGCESKWDAIRDILLSDIGLENFRDDYSQAILLHQCKMIFDLTETICKKMIKDALKLDSTGVGLNLRRVSYKEANDSHKLLTGDGLPGNLKNLNQGKLHKAWLRLADLNHEDRHPSPECREMYEKANEAYLTLRRFLKENGL